jgi:hypothetical protein
MIDSMRLRPLGGFPFKQLCWCSQALSNALTPGAEKPCKIEVSGAVGVVCDRPQFMTDNDLQKRRCHYFLGWPRRF